MNIRELTCIGCPMGCQLRATLENGVVTAVTGNTCPRGDAYARKECVHPERTVTGTVRVLGGPLPVVPVRTQGEVPKEKVLEVARAVTGHPIPAVFSPRRGGDPAQLVASSDRAREVLGWQPRYGDLETILSTAWAWHKNHPNGYEVE